jgi:hypothetical protein
MANPEAQATFGRYDPQLFSKSTSPSSCNQVYLTKKTDQYKSSAQILPKALLKYQLKKKMHLKHIKIR